MCVTGKVTLSNPCSCRSIWGFFRGVQRGGVSPEGSELPATSSPKACRKGRAHTHVPLKDTAMMASHPHLKTLRGTRGVPTPQVFLCALRPSGHPLKDKFPNALIQPLLRTSSMHSFSQKHPPQFETPSSCTGCQISLLALNQLFWVACLLWLYVLS